MDLATVIYREVQGPVLLTLKLPAQSSGQKQIYMTENNQN